MLMMNNNISKNQMIRNFVTIEEISNYFIECKNSTKSKEEG